MRLDRFQTLLDARGPHIDRWPKADRAEAEALLGESEAARAALADSEALDRALSDWPEAPASPLLRSAILDIPELHNQADPPAGGGPGLLGWTRRRPGLAAGWTAIAASAAIGFAVGVWWPVDEPAWQAEDLVMLTYGTPELLEVLR